MPLGWISTASESDGDTPPQCDSWIHSNVKKEIDFSGSTQTIFNSLMEDVLTKATQRNSTMPVEQQQRIVFSKATISTKTWDDATDDETPPWSLPDEQLSPGEIRETTVFDFPIPMKRSKSPTLSTMSEESGSTDTVGQLPTIPYSKNPMLQKRVYKLTNYAGSKPKLGKLFGSLSKSSNGKPTQVIYPAQNSYSSFGVKRPQRLFNNSSTIISSSPMKRRNEEIDTPSSIVLPHCKIYKSKKPVNRISTLIDLDSCPGKIKTNLQKFKEKKLSDHQTKNVSTDPKFDQSLVYKYKSKWNKFRIVGIDSLDDQSIRYIIANTEHTGFRQKVCPTQIESVNPSEDFIHHFSNSSTQTSFANSTKTCQTTTENTGTCKLFSNFNSKAVVKKETLQNDIQANRICELEKAMTLLQNRLTIATRINDANQLRMAQQEEKMLMNFSTTDFQRLYSQYQTRQKNRLDCFKKLERAYPELAKVAEATHANVKYDLPTAPLCVGNTLQHIVSNVGTCRNTHLPALPESYQETIPDVKESPIIHRIYSGKLI